MCVVVSDVAKLLDTSVLPSGPIHVTVIGTSEYTVHVSVTEELYCIRDILLTFTAGGGTMS